MRCEWKKMDDHDNLSFPVMVRIFLVILMKFLVTEC